VNFQALDIFSLSTESDRLAQM